MAKEMAQSAGAELVEVQHHWAHAAALMLDAGLEEIVCLTLDGTGYGADGQAWGGEVLHATFDDYERVAHLEGFPLLGGEMAVRDPRRLVFALSARAGLPLPYFSERDASVLINRAWRLRATLRSRSTSMPNSVRPVRESSRTTVSFSPTPAVKVIASRCPIWA